VHRGKRDEDTTVPPSRNHHREAVFNGCGHRSNGARPALTGCGGSKGGNTSFGWRCKRERSVPTGYLDAHHDGGDGKGQVKSAGGRQVGEGAYQSCAGGDLHSRKANKGGKNVAVKEDHGCGL
jgi:hypothetical protein